MGCLPLSHQSAVKFFITVGALTVLFAPTWTTKPVSGLFYLRNINMPQPDATIAVVLSRAEITELLEACRFAAPMSNAFNNPHFKNAKAKLQRSVKASNDTHPQEKSA
jgi:hypothetical protein